MSEEGGGKIKGKRQHGPSKPYQRRKSLLGKVKDLITPSWLSSFVTTAKPEEKEKHQDDRFMSAAMSPQPNRLKHQQNDMKPPPPVFVPLDKRNGTPNKISVMAPPQSTVIAHAKPAESVSTLSQDQVPVQMGFTSSQLPLIPEKMHDHHYENNDDNISDRSDNSKSTSGCSSMIPHPPSTTQKERVMLELNESDLSSIKDKLIESSETIQAKVGRSLTWSAQYNTKRPKRPALQGRPSFDISLFGSPVAGGNSSLLSDRLHESTFYPGRTTYGGAASQRRQSLGSTAPYQSSFPIRQKMKAKPMNNSFSSTATTSGTARKILETLEKMTTPLGDARKIPVDDTVMQSLSSSFSFTPSSYRRPTRHSIGSYLNSSRELQIPSRGPPLQKVSTPGSASRAANLQRFNTPEMDKRTPSNTDATFSYQLPGSSQRDQSTPLSSLQGGKMKSKKFSQHAPSSRKDDEDEQPYEIPNLKTDFTLPVKDMPSFNFSMPKSTPQFSIRPSTDSSSGSYTFSSPIQKMPITPTDTPTGPPRMDFKFSSPIQGDGSTSPQKTKSVTFNLGEDNSPFKLKTPAVSSNDTRTSVSKAPTSPSSNSPFTGGFKVATELKTGSVMDILGISSSSETKTYSEAEPKKNSLSQFASKGWTCDACLITNKDDVDKCVACTTPKPGAKPSLPKNDSLAKFAAKGWTCDSCLVSNKDDAEKCIACTANKPGLKKGLSKSKSTSGGSLQSMFKKPSGNWDCDVCLVPNKEEVTKCIACESPRPGTQPSSSGGFKIAPGAFSGQSGFVIPTGSNSNTNSGFSLGGGSKSTTQSGSGFKFGGDSKASTETGFKFGNSSVKASDDADKSKSGLENSVSDQKDKSSKSGFAFGKPNSLSADIALTSDKAEGSNKLSNDISKPKTSLVVENSLTDSTPAVGGFSFGKTSSESSDKSGISFGKSVSEKLIDSGTNLSVSTSTVATTGLSFTSSKPETKATTISSGFSFGQSTNNTSTSMGQKVNGGFVFGQTISSNKDNTSDIKTSSVNSIFGSDTKTSINSFTGTNNSGFSFNKEEDKKESEKPVFNTQSAMVSPSLKRSRDDENGPSDLKKPFAPSSTASASLFQFGAKTTASTGDPVSAPTSVFAFGQSKDKPSPFVTSSVNFGGTTTSSTTGFNTTPQSTSTISNFTGTSLSSGTAFGKTTTVTSSSTASTFVFGQSSTKPATNTTSTFGTPQQTSSVFGNNSSSFGSSTLSTAPSFGSNNTGFTNTPAAPTGGFGSTTPAFGSSSTNPSFGAPQTSSAPTFGAPSNLSFGAGQSSTPGFGNSQTLSGQTFGLSQTPSFGAATAPAVTTSAPGGFNFSGTASFNFGQSAAPTQPGGSIFQFGGSKPADTPQAPATAQTGGFNFSQTPSTPGGAPYNFNAAPTQSFGSTAGFGQPSTPQQSGTPGMFNIGASGNSDNRKIKKAVRKIRR